MDERLLIVVGDDDHCDVFVKKWLRMALELASFVVACTVVALLALFFWILARCFLALICCHPIELSVTIDGFSNLEERVPQELNLTMRIDYLRYRSEVCLGGGAVVLYVGGVPFTGDRVQDLCVLPKRAAEVAIATASGGVGTPKELAKLMEKEKPTDDAVHVDVEVISLGCKSLISCAALELEHEATSSCRATLLVNESNGVRPSGGYFS